MRYIKGFGIVLGIACLISAGIFPFAGQPGVRGYLFILACVCAGVVGVGGIFVYAAQGSRGATSDLERDRYISDDVLREMRKDAGSGASLGMELFFLGLSCLGLVILLLRTLPE